MNTPSRLQITLALAAVYLIWGSTYLAISVAVETLPPFLMAGTRFFLAGGLLYGWIGCRSGWPKPSRVHWGSAFIIGGLLLLGGNGLVAWAERRVPSGLTALLISVTPLWMALMEWARPGGVRPRRAVAVGLLLGLAGVVVLIGPENIAGGGKMDSLGAMTLIVATMSWAAGSLYSRHANLPDSPLLATGMEMLAGGVLLMGAGLLTREYGQIQWEEVSARSAWAYVYLVLIGSLVGFSAYIWLLKHVPLPLASSYAYVNPVVAVILGALLLNEPLTSRSLAAAAIIVPAVFLITVNRSAPPSEEKPLTALVPEEPGDV